MKATLLSAACLCLLTALAAPGCDGSGGSAAQYAAKCQLACASPTGPCASQNPSECQRQCGVVTQGLTALCAQCIADWSGWTGVQCVNGCRQTFGPQTTSLCTPGMSCTPADDKCNSFVIAQPNGSDCSSSCLTR